jgi:ADP-heptose:LPS heptosyltransferase
VLNRTSRYHNPTFDYSILKPYQDRITFVGLPQEFKVISAKLPDIKYHPVQDFYELAQVIKGSNLFIGNQSMAYAIAEQMKHHRILEICPSAHNVIPTGANGYGAWTVLNLIQLLKNG